MRYPMSRNKSFAERLIYEIKNNITRPHKEPAIVSIVAVTQLALQLALQIALISLLSRSSRYLSKILAALRAGAGAGTGAGTGVGAGAGVPIEGIYRH